jgi:hypothetical protein
MAVSIPLVCSYTLCLLPASFLFLSLSLSHTHTGKERHKRYAEAEQRYQNGNPTPEDLKRLANSKYPVLAPNHVGDMLLAVSVPFVCSYSLCLLPASVLGLTLTHTVNVGKYVCVHLYKFFIDALIYVLCL